jgi:hypothetical protein
MNDVARAAGRVIEVWRYPVAGLMGERLDRAELGPAGLTGDRAVGLWDTAAERLLDATTCPSLRLARARTESSTVIARLPDGDEVVIGAPRADQRLSAWLDREVQVRPAETGSWAPRIRILSLSSIAALARQHPTGQWDARRFRPHLLVVVPGIDFGEDAWVGSAVEIGATRLAVDEPTTGSDGWGVAQIGLAADADIPATVVAAHDATLGVTASVVQGGVVQPGDAVDPVPR